MRALLLVTCLWALPAVARAPALPAGTIQLHAGQLPWASGSPAMPPGTQIAVLEGNPAQPGMFTLRIKVPAGSRIAPHWHPRDERVTVIAGTVAVGFGDVVDEAQVTRFGAGGFYVNPARSHHYVLFPEEAVVQVTGEGPWELRFLDAAPKR
jgi:quercetin dioxygenase-like cupin family protein